MTPTTYKPKNDTDEQNPQFMFSMTANPLLVGIAMGQINPIEFALAELRARGSDPTDGEWVGFEGHGRLENLMKKHNFKVKPVPVIARELDSNSNEFTDAERHAITAILELMKAKNEVRALELALISGHTVKYFTLSELKK
jgi:hypothetical protein